MSADDSSTSTRRRTRRRIASVAVGLAVGLLLAELALRVVSLLGAPAPEPVERYVWPDRPHVRRWPAEGATGPRLLIAGDSFTFGAGVDETEAYPYLVAAELADYDVEVIAYSQPGWNTRALARDLARHLDEIDPDVFVLGLCLNDPERYPTARMLAERPDLQPWSPTGFERTLATASSLYRRTRLALDAIRLRPKLRAYYRGLYESENLAEWRDSLDKTRRLTRRLKVPAVLVVFPIFESDIDSDYAYGDLHDLVVEIATESGFEALDLRPAYADLPGRELALVPFTDPHPSRLAHAIAAREIARFLVARGLVAAAGEPAAPAAEPSAQRVR